MARPLASPPHPRRDESRRSLRGGRRSGVRYPDLCVSLRSRNPLALVAAVREELRLAGVEPAEIAHFSQEALETAVDLAQARRIAALWVGHVHLGGAEEPISDPR